jgi:hypothetical protein
VPQFPAGVLSMERVEEISVVRTLTGLHRCRVERAWSSSDEAPNRAVDTNWQAVSGTSSEGAVASFPQ